mmetsp:Transcript_19596/g.27185  ORF Transcript_19596/g.27185 Transcript_19596/m.27185 type:complete len:108 (+) Transcript_19596:128-451(+)
MEDEPTVEKAADPEEEEGEKDKRPMLALPAPSDAKRSETNTLKLGENVKFDKLGPVVINSDGTISRIANWDKMTETEKETTYRVVRIIQIILLFYTNNLSIAGFNSL